MNVEWRLRPPEKKYINGIFVAVQDLVTREEEGERRNQQVFHEVMKRGRG